MFCGVLVIGSGLAGLRAAIEAAKHTDVLVVTKDRLGESSTEHAQGGIAVVLSPEDQFAEHIKDTLAAGQGLCDPEIVKGVIEEGPARIKEMIDWGAKFDMENGSLLFAQEGGHGRARIIHAKGDATGLEVETTVVRKVMATPNIKILEHTFVIDLLTSDGACLGAVIADASRGRTMLWAKEVILASGGCGRIYRETTNPEIATGDGIALAYRAHAELQDLEFMQFHPTTLYVAGASRALITEAARGEGAILVNAKGERFMPRYHRQAELAPRDVVSRSIVKEMQRTNTTCVYLDLTHIPKEKLLARFPGIRDLCASFDIDITKAKIPVRPSAHYMVGGIKVARDGTTNIANLYACGETAATGLHGANRLGSNSLLEAVVFGQRAGAEAGRRAAKKKEPIPKRINSVINSPRAVALDLEDVRNSLRALMWRDVGIERGANSLNDAEKMIDFWCSYVMDKEFNSIKGWELQNMLTVARLIATAAHQREESRGVHFRSDFPHLDNKHWQRHIVLARPG
jgi:L-aspartate oxidase